MLKYLKLKTPENEKAKAKTMQHYLGTALRLVLASALIWFSMAVYVSSIANAAILKQDVRVSGDNIVLGDLFLGIENNRNAAYVLGPSPRPGENIVLDSRTLMRLSRAFRLGWSPENPYEQVVISRAATIVEAERIREAINTALRSEGYAENYQVNIHNLISDVMLPGYQEASIKVDHLRVDPASNSFRATVSMPASGPAQSELRVIGSLEHMIEVPMIKRSIKRGDIVRASDLDMIKIPEHQVTSDMILDASDLIGMTPRRVLTPNQIAKLSDVELPTLINRGSRVTMTFDEGPLKLTAMGKALQDGSKGDTVKVVNLSSNRVLDGIVTEDGSIEISSFN